MAASAGLLLTVFGCTDSVADHGSAALRATVLTGEFAVDPAAVHQGPLGASPAVAFGGSQYLVVWDDRRTGRPILHGGRIAADGSALDGFGFPILTATTPHGRYRPALASDGSDFLVVTPVADQLVGARVSAAGELLDLDGIAIADTVDSVVRASVSFGDEQYLVAWAQWAGPDDGVRWARVKPDGTVLDPGGVPGYPLESPPTWVGVSFDGSNFLLSWMDSDPEADTSVLAAVRIAQDGTPVDDSPIHIGSISGTYGLLGPVAGFDGTNHVLVWTHHLFIEDSEHFRIEASRVTPDGTVLDPDGILLFEDDPEFAGVERLDIAALAGRSTVVWSTVSSDSPESWTHRVRAAQLTSDGVVSSYPEDAFARGLEAVVETHADGGLVLWRRARFLNMLSTYSSEIIGTQLDAAGTPIADSVVAPTWSASNEEVVAAAYGEQRFFVLWEDSRAPMGDGKALYGARIAADGTPLDPAPIQITGYSSFRSEVVFDGASFVVSWVGYYGGGYQTVRVSPDGEVLDADPRQLPLWSSSAVPPTGASDGTHMLLIGDSYPSELAALLLDQKGAVASEVIPIAGQDELFGYDPGVSFDGVGYLVVWTGPTQLFGQLISKEGALVGERFTVVDQDPASVSGLAGGGGHHLLVWSDGSELRATRVRSDGQVLDPEGLLVSTVSWLRQASVTFDGSKFVVAWLASSIPGDQNSMDIHAAEVSIQGEVSPKLPISTTPEPEGPPALAGGDGLVLTAYSRFVAEAPYHARRAQARLHKHLPGLKLDVDAPGPEPLPDPDRRPVDTSIAPPPPSAGPQPSGAASGVAASGAAASGEAASGAASLHGSSPM